MNTHRVSSKVSRSFTSMKRKSYVMSGVFRKRKKYISGLRARVKLLCNILRKLLYIRDDASHARYKTVYLKCIKTISRYGYKTE